MPEFQCVQCFKCRTFQAQQVKKVDKFKCPICQASQSVRKVYAISSQAKDIRSVVTELNMRRADIDSAPVRLRAKAQPLPSAETDRRWSDFVTEDSMPIQFNSQDTHSRSDDFVTSLPDKAQRKRKICNQEDCCRTERTADKKPCDAARLPSFHHTAPAKPSMQSSSWTRSCVDAEQHTSSRIPTTEAGVGIVDSLKAEVQQTLPLSAANAVYGPDATLRKSTFHSMVPKQKPQCQPSSQPASRSTSSWSTFLEHGNVTNARLCDDQYAGSDADDELVTAID